MIINLQKPITKFIFFGIILISLFIFQKSNFNTVIDSANIFLSSILPSLFPFLLFSNMLLNLDGLIILKPILKDKYYFTFCIITGFLCGYPVGAKFVSTFLNEKKITYSQARLLLSFVNNCNPIFILSTIGLSILNNTYYALILLVSHYISAIIIFLIHYSHNIIHKTSKNSNDFKINETKILHNSVFYSINESVKSTLYTLWNIFSYTTIFSLLYSCIKELLNSLNISKKYITIIAPFFETTSGIKEIFQQTNFNITTTLCIISFFLGFSCLSIIFQIYSCIYNDKISILYIVKNKLIQGCISSLITYISLNTLRFFNFNLPINDVFSLNILNQNYSRYSYFVICVTLLYLLVISFNITKNSIKLHLNRNKNKKVT